MTDTYKHTSFTFSGGEEHVKLEGVYWNLPRVEFTHEIRSSGDLVRLGLIREALREMPNVKEVVVTIPYFPYARQDRVCNTGEAHSLRFFCNYLKMLDFHQIVTYDLHSDVAHGILPNLINIPRSERLHCGVPLGVYDALVSPDAGAVKKAYEDAKATRIKRVIKADKVRDVATGEILRTEVYVDNLTGMDLLITDDICDGGRTFIELCKVLKDKGANRVDLYVTHGIFSKGKEVLHEAGINNIYCHNDFTKE